MQKSEISRNHGVISLRVSKYVQCMNEVQFPVCGSYNHHFNACVCFAGPPTLSTLQQFVMLMSPVSLYEFEMGL